MTNNNDPDDDHGYPGLAEQAALYRQMVFPPCPHCGSSSVKKVEAGVIGRTVALAALTKRIHLVTSPKPGEFRCETCRNYFGPVPARP